MRRMNRRTAGVHVRSLALLSAIALHAGAVAWLWRAAEQRPAAPAIVVQLIERQAPTPPMVASESVAEPRPPAEQPPSPKPREPQLMKPKPPEPVAPRPPPPAAEPRVAAAPSPPATASQAAAAVEEPPRATPQGVATSSSTEIAVPPPPEQELAVHCSHRPPPAYPASARRAHQEGVVVLSVALSARGLVEKVSVIESSGHAQLDQAAQTAVRRWRCEPARVEGMPVPAEALQRIRFSLH